MPFYVIVVMVAGSKKSSGWREGGKNTWSIFAIILSFRNARCSVTLPFLAAEEAIARIVMNTCSLPHGHVDACTLVKSGDDDCVVGCGGHNNDECDGVGVRQLPSDGGMACCFKGGGSGSNDQLWYVTLMLLVL